MEKEYLAENVMTTDPFNTADTYHDEMPHHLADFCEHAGVGKACRRCRRKFDAASQWTRDYLAQQEVTDAEVLALIDSLAEQAGVFIMPLTASMALQDSRRAARRDEENR